MATVGPDAVAGEVPPPRPARARSGGKSRLVIHAGVEQPGAASIPRAFSRNRSLLGEHGVAYPRDLADPREGDVDRRGLNHRNLAWALNDRRVTTDRVNGWLKRASADGNRLVLLSASDFSRLKDLYFLSALRQKFEIEVVFYLCRQEEWINSRYSQTIQDVRAKSFEGMSADEFLESIDKFHWLMYFDVLERWSNFVGRENVKAKVIEDGQILDSAADLFSYCCGDDMPAAIEADVIRQRENDTLTALQVDLLRRLQFSSYAPEVRKDILEAAKAVAPGGTRNHYSRAVRVMIRDKFKKQNEQVAINYLGRDQLFLDQSFPAETYGFGSDILSEKDLIAFFDRLVATETA